MDRNKIVDSIEEIKKYVLENSTADDIEYKIDRLMSLKGQLDAKQVHFMIEEDEIIDKYECDEFRIYITDEYAHFMTTGGYHIFARVAMTSLYSTIKYMMNYLKSGKQDDIEDSAIEAMAYVLESPIFAFCDLETTIDIAKSVVVSLNKMCDKINNAELQKEDVEENVKFEEGMRAIEKLNEELPNIEKELENFEIKEKSTKRKNRKQK